MEFPRLFHIIQSIIYKIVDPPFGSKVKRSLYLSLVRSYVGHSGEVWTPPLHIGGLQAIEGVQRRARNFILGSQIP